MGRKRKNLNDRCLPPFVYRGKSSFELRNYQGKGLKLTCVKLCPLNSPISEVWAKYEEALGKPVYALKWLLSEYRKSVTFGERSYTTRSGQEGQIDFLCRYKSTKTGKLFCEVELKNFSRGIIRKFLDSRKADDSPISGNREKALISKAWNWALERDLIKCPNPCIGVVRNTERPRTRYVTDSEYDIVYKLAVSYLPYLPIMMELAYLCRMRRGEILQATKSQIKDEGFYTKRLKGSCNAITLWTPRLRYVINSAKNLPSRTNTINLHDLKAKGVSDFDGNKQDASGHKTLAQVTIYDRKEKSVKATR